MSRLIRGILLLAASVTLMSGAAVTVRAATVKELKENVYTDLDFNGDGKKDRFVIGKRDQQTGELPLTLNGKTTKVFVARGYQIHYYKYNNANTFLLVYTQQYGGGYVSAYRYSGTKLVRKTVMAHLERNSFKKASGKYIYIATSPYRQSNLASFRDLVLSNGRITTFWMKYRLDTKNHRFVLSSRYAAAGGTYYVTYKGASFKTSTTPVKINKKGLVLTKGKRYKLTRMYKGKGRNPKYYFKVMSGKKYGWFASSASVPFR